MPRQTSNLLDPSCFSMGALAIDVDDVGSEIYLTLGLKGKGAKGKPRFLSFLSHLLERSIQQNEIVTELPAQPKDVRTVFDGSSPPPVSIQQYIERIFEYAGCSPSCFIVAYIYVDRYLQSNGDQLTSFNVHRLLITSVMLAAKFVDDAFFNNAYYAKVGGISTTEMNKLELKFLFSVDFRLQVNVETFRKYCQRLHKESTTRCQVDRPVRSCLIKDTWPKNDDSACSTTVAR